MASSVQKTNDTKSKGVEQGHGLSKNQGVEQEKKKKKTKREEEQGEKKRRRRRKRGG